MNALTSNQNGQFKNYQSRPRLLAKNLKNKLTSNFVKHCTNRFNRKTNQETSFIDCESRQDSLKPTDQQANGANGHLNNKKLNNWSYDIRSKEGKVNSASNNVNKDSKLIKKFDGEKNTDNKHEDGEQCKQNECNQSTNYLTLDHNKNYEKTADFDVNFDENFRNIDLDQNEEFKKEPNEKFEDNKNELSIKADQNDKIINEFLNYTNKLTATNSSFDNKRANLNQQANTTSTDSKDNIPNKAYYNCSDKVLDASVLDSYANRNQSIGSVLDNENIDQRSNQLGRPNKNHQANLNSQPKVILRRHVRKEAMDVKSARKQVSRFFSVTCFFVVFFSKIRL